MIVELMLRASDDNQLSESGQASAANITNWRKKADRVSKVS